jgi:glutathione-regulated potassium-efflux system ancillary protein KefC
MEEAMMPKTDLLVATLTFLAAAVVCVPIASRLGLGSVLGYLVAGCLIGPHVLGLVRDVEAIMHLAEIGVVLMLFIIGLELDPRRLWNMRKMVFGGGALQMLACTVVLSLGALSAGLPWQSALIAGLALSLSSTAISVQTMGERGLLGGPLGRSAFGVLLFQDLAAIPIMSVVPLLAMNSQTSGRGVASAIEGILAIAAVVGIGRYLTRPVLHGVARAGLREVFTAVALLLVLGMAKLMALADLSMALGSFLAGVLLAGSEYRHALETDIEPFKGLLMGLFFISVGMSIDFHLLAAEPLLILALVLGFQLLKLATLAAIAPKLDVSRPQRFLLAALLAQGGEFAFVVFGVARSAQALPNAWEGRLTLTVALSMALSPLLLLLHDRFHARQAQADMEDDDIPEGQDAPIIIAGFGRFGQIVGRLLFASGLRATVLDHDPDQIETLRRFGFRVFYGDATRLDLLHAAGIARARLLVNAIDDMESSLKLVELLREHYPQLEIVARARNVTHYFELRERGVTLIERETFESAISVGKKALQTLGVAPYEAKERADKFRRHNLRSLEALVPYYHDEARRLSMARAAREELEKQFERDEAALRAQSGQSWHDELKAADEERQAR